jgi:hypothetical protein
VRGSALAGGRRARPQLLGHLARLGAHDIQLAGWMKRVRKIIGVVPAEWDGLVEKISRERGR